MIFAEIAMKSGLNKKELALIYGVSRQTIHDWIREGGGPRAGSYTARMATTIGGGLEFAIRKGTLPLADMEREHRGAYIAALAKQLQSLKPAPI